MLSRFIEFIERNNLLEEKDNVLLAVSGGLDSMVMLDLFRQAGYAIAVAHCNFQLRGDESDGDEIFVKKYCLEHKIKFFHRSFQTNKHAGENGISIQMAARDLRYQWFDMLMVAESFHWLATAHHLNDNIETVLLRWTQGLGLDQLTGIPIKNEKVIRPMLFATRSEIETYASVQKILWREDSSNSSSGYHRNFIRHQVIPKLKEINPSLEHTFSESLLKIKGASELMRRGLGQLRDSISRTEGDRFFIDKSLLMLLDNPVFVCYEWLKIYGFEWDRCKQLVSSIHGQSGTQFFSSTHQAVIDREFIIISPRAEALNEILIEEGQDKAALGPWLLKLRMVSGNGIEGGAALASLDFSKIKFPMLWRKWKNGDAFFPLGSGHRKKVSDFLVDQKIPLTDKSQVTVLESGGEVIWVVGHRVDDRFKVTSQTHKVLNIHLNHI